MREELTPSRQKIIETIWNFRVQNGDWPREKWCIIQLFDQGIDVKEDGSPVRRELRGPSSSKQTPHLALDAHSILQLPAGRELFAPIPELLRLGAAKFVTNHPFSDDWTVPPPLLTYGELVAAWGGDTLKAHLAVDLMMRASPFPFNIHSQTASGEADFRFSRSILRYEKVESLDECLALATYTPLVAVGMFPSGKHLALLDAVFQHVRDHGAWPSALPFAVKHRGIGNVAALVDELHHNRPVFVRGSFGEGKHDHIVLRAEAIPFVDRSGDVRAQIPNIVRAAATDYRASDLEDVLVPETHLWKAIGVTHADLAPTLLFMAHDHWMNNGGFIGLAGHDWDFHVDRRVLKMEGIATYDDYRAALEGSPSSWSQTESTVHVGLDGDDSERKESMVRTDLAPRLRFMKSEEYRNIIESDLADLDRTITAGAVKPALIMLGSILEALLLDVLQRNSPRVLAQLKGVQFERASLPRLIAIAANEGLISHEVAKASASFINDQRDLVHPHRAMRTKSRFDQSLIDLAVPFLVQVVRDLERAAEDGRMYAFERARS